LYPDRVPIDLLGYIDFIAKYQEHRDKKKDLKTLKTVVIHKFFNDRVSDFVGETLIVAVKISRNVDRDAFPLSSVQLSCKCSLLSTIENNFSW
jgi:hypothetical protein